MHPILAKFGILTIYSYGAMVALGFGLATLLIYKQAPKFNIDKNKILDLVILLLVTGIIGGRLFYILLNLNYYLANPIEVVNLSKGGLVWYGGFLLELFVVMLYTRINGLNFWTVTDLVAPYVALAQTFGRIGCFLNGCCYGIEVQPGYPLAVAFPHESILRYPTQLYSAVVLVFILIVLRVLQDKRHFNGEIFLAYCVLYSVKRFFIEFLRGDNPRIIAGLTLSQSISIIVFLASFILFIYKAMEWRKKNLGLK